MKNLKCLVILFTVATAMFMTACQKDASEELATPTNRIDTQMQEAYDEYMAQHDELTIEYATLEELNEVYVANGMAPVTLEELGITEEEYEAAQKRINDPNFAQSRCSGFIAVWYGDMNNNGTLSAYDIALANAWISTFHSVPTTNAPLSYRKFGLFSTENSIWGPLANGTEAEFCNNRDRLIAQQIILLAYPCM